MAKDLEATIESNKDEKLLIRNDARVQTAKLEEELRTARDSIGTVEMLLQFVASLRPLRLRILLNFVADSRAEIWDVLRNEEDIGTFRDRLYALLAGDPYRPTVHTTSW